MYKKNAWKDFSKEQYKNCFDFSEEYRTFISENKTERECTSSIIESAKAAGYKDINELIKNKEKLNAGDKLYACNYDKQVALFIIGKKPLEDGMRILGAHIDSPRLDVKQNPLYEKDGVAYLDTHYYGGIKKYQWVTIPLAIHGVICKKDGNKVQVNIGEDDNDPIFGISDLLIHLSADQLKKTADKVIKGEDLDLMVGNLPINDESENQVKANVLKLIKDKYDFEEEDFMSGELEIVPAGKARNYGLDESMIAGYGHDDRVCAYTSLRAILDVNDPEYTCACLLVDKEEIGSVGATGMSGYFFENIVNELILLESAESMIKARRCLNNSRMLSSDVSAAHDPIYSRVDEIKNAAFLANGICFNKYTGSRGKSGSNDANPEFMANIRNMLDEDNIHFQTCELGKVDQGGGGTIAYLCAKYNMQVIDAGVAVINMHAPMEVVSKADVYETYRAYCSFLKKA